MISLPFSIMTFHPEPRFPVEILDLFVDEIANFHDLDARATTLSTCSLVSRSFAHRARKHIFRSIELSEWDGDTLLRAQRLYDILIWTSSTPGRLMNVAPLVKEFLLDCESLPNPEEVEGIVVLDELGVDFRCSLINLFRSPRLKYLHLHGLQEVPKTLLLGTHIQVLVLEDISCTDRVDTPCEAFLSPESLHGASYPQLVDLALDGPYWSYLPLLENKGNAVPGPKTSALTGLHKLSVVINDEEDYAWMSAILMRTQESLEDLSIIYGFGSPDDAAPAMLQDPIDLSSMKQLHSIHVDHLGDGQRLIEALHSSELLFDTLTISNTLKTLDLGFFVDLSLNEEHQNAYTTMAAFIATLVEPSENNVWETLNEIFATKFRRLEQVEINLGFMEDGPGTPVVDHEFADIAKELIRSTLPFFSKNTGHVPRLKVEVAED
ncbi:hypothetical protein NLJ89_g10668 [Agrocybe chaxingu]|uniref:Uncharacterized protein n=1 Tax=Agrocybe chaxingu TaxID=84603 RepID=A0A9W8JQA6_9AGAR|nr:hypothetical protein NLJ89_g10668 [Agrocybe chaxingu]